MKFNNPIIVFDLETTGCDTQAITEIGAVILDGNLDAIGEWESFVKPDVPVTEKAFEITQHKPEWLNNARPWSEVGSEFESWVEATTKRNIKQARLAAWGNYFDVNVMRSQYARYGLAMPFSGTCLDVKTAALMWCALSGKRTDSLSVSKCADYMSFKPCGQYHRALVDADMTSRIFQRVMEEISGGVWIANQYITVAKKD